MKKYHLKLWMRFKIGCILMFGDSAPSKLGFSHWFDISIRLGVVISTISRVRPLIVLFSSYEFCRLSAIDSTRHSCVVQMQSGFQ